MFVMIMCREREYYDDDDDDEKQVERGNVKWDNMCICVLRDFFFIFKMVRTKKRFTQYNKKKSQIIKEIECQNARCGAVWLCVLTNASEMIW